MSDDLSKRPLIERARYYRSMAEEAMRSAEGAQSPLAKADFVKLAHNWHVLASQIESAVGFIVDPDNPTDESPILHFRQPPGRLS